MPKRMELKTGTSSLVPSLHLVLFSIVRDSASTNSRIGSNYEIKEFGRRSIFRSGKCGKMPHSRGSRKSEWLCHSKIVSDVWLYWNSGGTSSHFLSTKRSRVLFTLQIDASTLRWDVFVWNAMILQFLQPRSSRSCNWALQFDPNQ